ncbi:prophage tail fiber N-terminal domain-containing protein, partial [Escherichia coli]
MAVKISGVLKDGTGKPVQNCTIQLKAKNQPAMPAHQPVRRQPMRLMLQI